MPDRDRFIYVPIDVVNVYVVGYAYMESNESYILQGNAENGVRRAFYSRAALGSAQTQLPLRFYKQKGSKC